MANNQTKRDGVMKVLKDGLAPTNGDDVLDNALVQITFEGDIVHIELSQKGVRQLTIK